MAINKTNTNAKRPAKKLAAPAKKASVLDREVKAAQKTLDKLRADMAKQVAAGKKAILKARAELKTLKDSSRSAHAAEKAAAKEKLAVKAKAAAKPAAKKAVAKKATPAAKPAATKSAKAMKVSAANTAKVAKSGKTPAAAKPVAKVRRTKAIALVASTTQTAAKDVASA